MRSITKVKIKPREERDRQFVAVGVAHDSKNNLVFTGFWAFIAIADFV